MKITAEERRVWEDQFKRAVGVLDTLAHILSYGTDQRTRLAYQLVDRLLEELREGLEEIFRPDAH